MVYRFILAQLMRDGIYARKQTRPFKIILPQDCMQYEQRLNGLQTVRDNTAARLQKKTHEQRLNQLQTVRE